MKTIGPNTESVECELFDEFLSDEQSCSFQPCPADGSDPFALAAWLEELDICN